MYVCMHVFMYACMHVCVFENQLCRNYIMYVHVCVYEKDVIIYPQCHKYTESEARAEP